MTKRPEKDGATPSRSAPPSRAATPSRPAARRRPAGAAQHTAARRKNQPTLHEGDLPDGLDLGAEVAVDTETMGLRPERDRLCLVQLSSGDGTAHLVRAGPEPWRPPNLSRMLSDPKTLKIFHFARFDLAMLLRRMDVDCGPVWCTKVASRLARTYTDRHGLRDLCYELLGRQISKQQQTSDWGAAELTPAQMHYAAGDVLHLHALKERLEEMLAREGRDALAQACFEFLPTRARLDLLGWNDPARDLLEH